jgi:hypothetical protein
VFGGGKLLYSSLFFVACKVWSSYCLTKAPHQRCSTRVDSCIPRKDYTRNESMSKRSSLLQMILKMFQNIGNDNLAIQINILSLLWHFFAPPLKVRLHVRFWNAFLLLWYLAIVNESGLSDAFSGASITSICE